MAERKRYSDEAVKKATGKVWSEWFKILDKAGMKSKEHKEVVQWLHAQELINSAWWCQGVTVEYEFHHGKRKVGETKESGFQVGVQKSFNLSRDKAWKLITSPRGLKVWLGDNGEFKPMAGYGYRTKDGTSGEIRTVDPGKRLRLSWKLPAQRQFSTLQIYLLPVGKGTAIRFHHEKLSGSAERQAMHKHWQEVLDKLEKEAKNG